MSIQGNDNSLYLAVHITQDSRAIVVGLVVLFAEELDWDCRNIYLANVLAGHFRAVQSVVNGEFSAERSRKCRNMTLAYGARCI